MAEKSWRKLNAPELLLVTSGVPLKEGKITSSGRVNSDGNNQSERTAACTLFLHLSTVAQTHVSVRSGTIEGFSHGM